MTTVDWSKAPEGATHYRPQCGLFYREDCGLFFWDDAHWIKSDEPELLTCRNGGLIPRPTSATDPAHQQSAEVGKGILMFGASLSCGAVAAEQENERLKKALADAELRECKLLALYSKAEATIGAALIEFETHGKMNGEYAQEWLGSFMENTETPWHLYDDATKFYELYKMDYPLTVAQHQENVKKLDAVFDADMARMKEQDDEN